MRCEKAGRAAQPWIRASCKHAEFLEVLESEALHLSARPHSRAGDSGWPANRVASTSQHAQENQILHQIIFVCMQVPAPGGAGAMLSNLRRNEYEIEINLYLNTCDIHAE